MADDYPAGLANELAAFEKPGGQYHEAFSRGDKEVQELRSKIFQKYFPEPTVQPSDSEARPTPTNDSSPALAAKPIPTDTTGGNDVAAMKICQEELKARWGQNYDQNQANAVRSLGFFFGADGDDVISERINESTLANDPNFIDHLRKLEKELPQNFGRPPDISGISQSERENLIRSLLGFTFSDFKTNRLLKTFLQAIGNDQAAKDWATRKAVLLFREPRR